MKVKNRDKLQPKHPYQPLMYLIVLGIHKHMYDTTGGLGLVYWFEFKIFQSCQLWGFSFP